MSNNACEAQALERLVEQWAARIKRPSGTTVEAILIRAENVLNALGDLRPHGPKARRMLLARSRLSRPMVSKLEAIGRHAKLFRPRARKLPPSMSSLYALTLKPWREFHLAINMDLSGASRSEIEQLFAPKAMCKLVTIKVPCDAGETARLPLIADVRAAIERIGEVHGIGLAVSPRTTSTARHCSNGLITLGNPLLHAQRES